MSRLHRFAILSAVAALSLAAVVPPATAQVATPSELVYPPLPAFQAPKPTRVMSIPVRPSGTVGSALMFPPASYRAGTRCRHAPTSLHPIGAAVQQKKLLGSSTYDDESWS